MKNRFLSCLLVCIYIGMALLNTSGCDAAQASLTPTNTLSIYLPPRDGGLEYISDPLRLALGPFRQQYPDVQVSIRDFNDPQNPQNAYNTFVETLKTELAAGKGPDLVYFASGDFDDIEKTIESGVFFDLNKAIAQDKSFDMDGYIPSLMSVFQRKGSLPLIPVEYSAFTFITSQETLDEAGIKPTSNLDSFLTELKQYYEKMKTRQPVDADYSPSWLFSCLIDYSGMPILDYQQKSVTLDTVQFRHLAETYKVIYAREQDVSEADRTAGGQFADFFLKGGSLFSSASGGYGILSRLSEITMAGQTPVLFPVPSARDPSSQGMLEPFIIAGIPKGSPNKLNAYNLLKVLIEKTHDPMTDSYPQFTMRLDIFPKMLDYFSNEAINQLQAFGKGTGASMEKIEAARKDAVNQVQTLLINAPATLGLSQPAVKILWNEMEPYFKGSCSLDEAIASAKEKLQLYMDE